MSANRVRGPLRFRASAGFDGWRSVMFGACLDWGVMRAGEAGVERAVELDVALGLWSVCFSCYWILEPRHPDEHFLDTLMRFEAANPQEDKTDARKDDRMTGALDIPGATPLGVDDWQQLLGDTATTFDAFYEIEAPNTTATAKDVRAFAAALPRLLAPARARDVAIAHLARGDVPGALSALTMQRDTPALFDGAQFDGEPA